MTDAAVKSVDKHPKNAEWRTVTLDDARQFIVFSAGLADALEIGKPLPQGTEEQPPKFEGALPSLRLPKAGGGGGWRQSKEAFELEQKVWAEKNALDEQHRRERQAIEQRSIHASVALERATEIVIALRGSRVPTSEDTVEGLLFRLAEQMNVWLRETAQKPLGATESQFQSRGGAGDGGSSGAAPEPGEGQEQPSPGSIRFPFTPETCDQGTGPHKLASGNWVPTVQIDGMAHCKRCGMKTVLYRESDVGP